MQPDRRLGRGKTNNLAILSFNIEGIRGNAPYLQELLRVNDVLCLQEHWLWDFEKHDSNLLFPGYNYHIRSVDTEFPKSHFVRSRGYGGVLIAWKETFDNYIRPLENGNNV